MEDRLERYVEMIETGMITYDNFKDLKIEDMLKKVKGYYLFVHFLNNGWIFACIGILENNGYDNPLFVKINGKEFIEYILETFNYSNNILKIMVPLINDKDYLLKLCRERNDYEIFKYAKSDILYSSYIDDRLVLEVLINDFKIVPMSILEDIRCDNISEDNIKLLLEKKLYCCFEKPSSRVLLTKLESSITVLEYLIKNGFIPDFSSCNDIKSVIDILNKCNRLDLIQGTYINNSVLLEKASNILNNRSLGDITLLEYFIDNNYDIKLGTVDLSFLIDILIEKKRLDLLENSELYLFVLLKFYSEDKRYLDYILEAIKRDNLKININKIILGNVIEEQAIFYIKVAEYDMMDYLKSLSKEKLLESKDGITLLEVLLKMNSDLTINKIIPSSLEEDKDIISILMKNGYEVDRVEVLINNEDRSSIISNILNVKRPSLLGPLSEEGVVLLKELEDLFLSDGVSDKNLIDLLVACYRNALIANYDINISELRNLIKIKKEHYQDFCYKTTDGNGHFNKCVYSTLAVSTILHETGHAIHYYLTGNRVPDNYMEVLERTRNNPEVLKAVYEFSVRYRDEILPKIKGLAEKACQSFLDSYYTDGKRDEISKFLSMSKEDKIREYEGLGIDTEKLKVIFDNNFTMDRYIEEQKWLYINGRYKMLINNEYPSIGAIADIIDAIFEGKVKSGKLVLPNGEEVPRIPGHGLSYYYSTIHDFYEMMANFSVISKSIHYEEDIEKLRSIVGNEVFDMISDFYYANIAGVDVKFQDKKRGGK